MSSPRTTVPERASPGAARTVPRPPRNTGTGDSFASAGSVRSTTSSGSVMWHDSTITSECERRAASGSSAAGMSPPSSTTR